MIRQSEKKNGKISSLETEIVQILSNLKSESLSTSKKRKMDVQSQGMDDFGAWGRKKSKRCRIERPESNRSKGGDILWKEQQRDCSPSKSAKLNFLANLAKKINPKNLGNDSEETIRSQASFVFNSSEGNQGNGPLSCIQSKTISLMERSDCTKLPPDLVPINHVNCSNFDYPFSLSSIVLPSIPMNLFNASYKLNSNF